MAKSAIKATHVGLVKYAARARSSYGGSKYAGKSVAFCWVSIALWVDDMEPGLSIMSIPSPTVTPA